MIIERLNRFTAYPVTLKDLRAHARLDGDAHDNAQILRIARAGARKAEEHGDLPLFFPLVATGVRWSLLCLPILDRLKPEFSALVMAAGW
ncbi:hypothetical protein [Paracoccus zhejiangensis]|uniref:Uncharacterized protein n=1 Tax=Paracoccus zhejiangensis TaxID=1077935 RepID=A0A2H5F1A1_9RHOB|nr:hypothetical protein [Paracoccus zhejiangensis]AUH65313.1 hypothetical protein CX676_15015 [Paracoccus zhejiangensis]